MKNLGIKKFVTTGLILTINVQPRLDLFKKLALTSIKIKLKMFNKNYKNRMIFQK